MSYLVKTLNFSSFLAEFKCAEGRMIRYRYPCFNDFGYRIVGKYWYFRYIVHRYTSLHDTIAELIEQYINCVALPLGYKFIQAFCPK